MNNTIFILILLIIVKLILLIAQIIIFFILIIIKLGLITRPSELDPEPNQENWVLKGDPIRLGLGSCVKTQF